MPLPETVRVKAHFNIIASNEAVSASLSNQEKFTRVFRARDDGT
jgi:hypothetical protein